MSLRTTAVRGGLYMGLRQGLGIAVSTIGLILLTRILGPEAFGIWVAALGIYDYFLKLSGWGVDIYLIRQEGEPSAQDYHQAFTLLLLSGLAGTGLAFLALPLIGRWTGLEELGPVAAFLFAGLSVNLMARVPLALLERALDYRKVALIELSELLVLYPVAIPLAYQGLGAWAPVAGWWASRLVSLGLAYYLSGYRPRFYWETGRIRAMVRFGTAYAAAEWVWMLNTLVNPLIVGRYLGAEAVGQIGLAIRLVEPIHNVAAVPIRRISLPVFVRVREDQVRLVKALNEGMILQVMSLGPILAGVGLIAPWIIPLLLGSKWLPALEVYPFIATGYLTGAAVGLHASILYLLGKTWIVAVQRLIHSALFVGAALLLVPHLGLIGYGWTEIVPLLSYLLLLIWVLVYVGKPISVPAGIWYVAWVLPLFSWQLGPWTWVSAIVPFLWPTSRRPLRRAVAVVIRSTQKSTLD
jgi:O-antigen/teichoic acid export membrane protein